MQENVLENPQLVSKMRTNDLIEASCPRTRRALDIPESWGLWLEFVLMAVLQQQCAFIAGCCGAGAGWCC